MSNYAFRISGTCLTSGITSAFFEAVKNDMRLVLLKIDFKISSIDSVEIEGNNRLLLRAQFRLIPRLIVGGRVSSLGSYCDFEYDWRSTDDKVI